ncbi:MAG TPA: DUF5615 family PIN-like protein [Thermoanaerobaculia bacterium]
MRFIVDAQLPRRIAAWLRGQGHDAIHTLELPEANRTTDTAINELATREGRIVITKDSDFVDSHLLQRRPEKLLLVSTGNITNRELEAVLLPNIPALVAAFESSDFVELSRTGLLVHG